MTVPLVYVVVLNWNRREDTIECLDSVGRMSYPHFKVLLVDNGSTDGSVEAVRAQFPGVEILASRTNLGYAAGCNLGMRYALDEGAEYVLLLNNDTVVDPSTLDTVVAVAEEVPRAGMLSPAVYQYEDPSRVWPAAGHWRRLTLSAIPFRNGGRRGSGGRPQEADYVLGCALLMKRRLLEDVGLFDPRFFLYYEDYDLCRRAHAEGYKLLYVPQARIAHKVSGSAGQNTPLQRYYLAKGRVHFLAKHTRGIHRCFMVLYGLSLALRWTGAAWLQGRSEVVRPFLQGLYDGLWEIRNKKSLPAAAWRDR